MMMSATSFDILRGRPGSVNEEGPAWVQIGDMERPKSLHFLTDMGRRKVQQGFHTFFEACITTVL